MRYLLLAAIVAVAGCVDEREPVQPSPKRGVNATPNRDYRDWIWYDTGQPSGSQAEMEEKLKQDGKGGYWVEPSRGATQ